MHVSVLYVIRRNYEVAVFGTVNLALFMAGAAILVPLTGLSGYGWAEIAALPSYLILHRFIYRAVGRPTYGISAVWWIGTALGLFSRQLGAWAIAMPFIALLWPASVRRLRTIAIEVLGLGRDG
jgi:hypothetical protein